MRIKIFTFAWLIPCFACGDEDVPFSPPSTPDAGAELGGIAFNPADLPVGNPSDATQEGDWTGVLGAISAVSGDNSWTRVTIQALGNYGAERKLLLPEDATEAFVTYCMRLGSNWTPTSNVKLPGFSSQQTGGDAGGQGGGGSGGDLAYSARMIIERPGTDFTSGGLGYEMYHDASSNAPFGEAMWWGEELDESSPRAEASIADGAWHCIKQHLALNTAGENDGVIEGWMDGHKLFERRDLGFTDRAEYRDIAFYFDVYHGGSADTSGTAHDIFFDRFRYSIGPVDPSPAP